MNALAKDKPAAEAAAKAYYQDLELITVSSRRKQGAAAKVKRKLQRSDKLFILDYSLLTAAMLAHKGLIETSVVCCMMLLTNRKGKLEQTACLTVLFLCSLCRAHTSSL
ncbi:unnamed protein product [Chrysoparadoxa australica]